MSQLIELDPVLVQRLRRPERPRAQQRAPAASRARPVVIRIAFGIVLCAAAVAFAGRLTHLAAEPVLSTYRTGLEIRRLERVLARQGAVNAQLTRDIVYLKTPAGVEQEARRRGWVKPGEVALTVVLPDHDGAAKSGRATVADEPAPHKAVAVPIAERIRTAVDTCLAVLGGYDTRPP